MANKIELAKIYSNVCDLVYKQASKTTDLDTNAALIQQGANANEIIVPMIDMQGLGDYQRNSGYVDGDVDVTNQTVKCDYDRGRMFSVDRLDDQETGGVAFGMLAGEFIRTKVVPELDAKRFANYASAEGISRATGELTDGTQVIKALRDATNKMDEDEVDAEDRILYITPTLHGMIQDLDTSKSREVLNSFAKVVPVPQRRFYTAIDLRDGRTEGQEQGGYSKANHSFTAQGDGSTKKYTISDKPAVLQKVTVDGNENKYTYDSATGELEFNTAPGSGKAIVVVYNTGTDINFLIVQKRAPIQAPKLVAPKIVTPDENQKADAWKYGYRLVSYANVYKNKAAGIFCHAKSV